MRTVPEELRLAFVLHVVHQVVGADGVIDPREQAVVEQLLPTDALVAAGLVDASGARTARFEELAGEALVTLPLRLGRADKTAILDQLYEAALADGELHREEGWVLAHTGRLLGLSGADYDAWLASRRQDASTEESLRLALRLHLIERLAAADGEVDARERSVGERLAPLQDRVRLGLALADGTPTPVAARRVREALAVLPLRLSRTEKLALLDECWSLALADGDWHREEAWLVAEFARLLGLTGTEFDQWLAGKPGSAPVAAVLSYSAGSTQTGPDGYRKLGRGPDLRRLLARWPDLAEALAGRTPMVINAYPAALGNFDYAVYVDTYLSPKTASRALQLAARDAMPVFLLGQPLLLAEMLIRHREAGRPLPDVVVAAVGGYACPASLERALREAVGPSVRFELLQGYGAAEVDAGLLFGRHRTPLGEVIYEPRGPDAIVQRSEEGRLLLGLRAADGRVLIDGFDTGDFVEPWAGGGYVIRNAGRRMHPDVTRELESWTSADWSRRTGYLSRSADRLQLRDGVEPRDERELPYHAFAGAFGGVWLAKPDWS